MKKIKTSIGYMYLPNESTVENTTALFNKMTSRKEINIINITSDDAKKAYRTINPYGVGYTDCFDCFLASQISTMKLNAGKLDRKIDFLEIS